MDTQLMLWAITRERHAEIARSQLASAVERDGGYSSLVWSAPPVQICLRESLLVRLASAFTRRLPVRTTTS
jgi:phage-related protein